MRRSDWLVCSAALAVVFYLAGTWPKPEEHFALVPAPNTRLHIPGYPDPVPLHKGLSRKAIESIFRLMEDHRRRFSP